MDTSLTSYRQELQERVLELLWRHWCALGVFGNAKPPAERVIDPEALVTATCSFGRCDPRMFDEMLDWLTVNGYFINTQRLRNLVTKRVLHGAPVVGAVAAFLRQNDKSARWRTLARLPGVSQPEPLFRFRDGRPHPGFGEPEPVFSAHGFLRGPVELRGYSQTFEPRFPACLGMRLRALFGVNVRAEAILFLLTHLDGANPTAMARLIGYGQRSVQDALRMMARSGWVRAREEARQSIYTLAPESRTMFLDLESPAQWTAWPLVWRYLETLWAALGDTTFPELSPILQGSQLRDALADVGKQLSAAGFADLFSRPIPPRGEEYRDFVLETAKNLLDTLEE